MCSMKTISRVLLLAIPLSVAIIGCGPSPSATTGVSAIEETIAGYKIVTKPVGDAPIGGDSDGSEIILVIAQWADFPQILNETADGNSGFNHISRLTFFISVGGDSFAVVEQVANSIRADRSVASQLLHHPDPRVRYATLYTLGQSQPYSRHFAGASESIIDSLIEVTASANVFEIVKALDLLPRDFRLDAFTNGMSHPSSQLRLATLNYLTFSDLDDSQRLKVLPVLVGQLKDRDRVVRETAFSEINSIMQHWRQQRHDKLKLAPEILELIETVPSDPGNGNWYKVMASVLESLTANQARWVEWIDANQNSAPLK